MGYPIFGKVKTIVLPMECITAYTGSEYLNKFGINLLDIVEFKQNADASLRMEFKNKNALHLVKFIFDDISYEKEIVFGTHLVSWQPDISGQNECQLRAYIPRYYNDEASFDSPHFAVIRMVNNTHDLNEIILDDLEIGVVEL